ncbi:metallophosphoesterase family protein [Consotaella salsifontis]|uniref:Calcineurin-like phosphoesterase superfamily protein n=1 Tax=Consotaella salsifontis TaxID=1365950 RepID=A0A1T4T7C5_9HYPH|nr:metallophosphoesterase family protein [Consotaella salsifontis]SKA36293.1 Calcineurin-like phosphoesterase superfamily protein [Consotaella salsifontis]
MALFFTSDTHFTDPRILRIDRRPFANLSAHDEALIANWNAVVAPSDEVWHLGDFARGSQDHVEALLARLNGSKHLIIGNNDGPATLEASGWASVHHYTEMTIDDRLVILCHYPFRTWNGMSRKSVDLHGHSHGKLSPTTRQYDVGVDVWDFRPVGFEEIVTRRRRAVSRDRSDRGRPSARPAPPRPHGDDA